MVQRILVTRHDENKDVIIGFIAMNCISICCSAFITFQCYRQYRLRGEQTSTVVRFLGIKAVFDFIYEINSLSFVSFLYHTGGRKQMEGPVCTFLGFIDQFFILGEMTMNFCIALDVFLLLVNPWTYDTRVWRNRMLWGLLLLCCTTFGLLGADQLGNSGDNNCWVKNPAGWAGWFLYGPAFFYWGFCVFAVGFLTFKIIQTNSIRAEGEFFRSVLAKRMLTKMSLFTGMYLVSWSLILYRHLLELNGTSPEDISMNIQYTATFFVHALGLWDLGVWYGNLIKCPCLERSSSKSEDGDEGRGSGDGFDDLKAQGKLETLDERVRASTGDAGSLHGSLSRLSGSSIAKTKALQMPERHEEDIDPA